RDHKPTLGPYRYTDIVEIILDEIVALDMPVNDWHGLQRFHGCLNKERHQPEFDSVLLRKLILFVPAQFLNSAHVAFVKRRENRRGVLRHHKLLRNFAAQW